jgi:hypothetical protein
METGMEGISVVTLCVPHFGVFILVWGLEVGIRE